MTLSVKLNHDQQEAVNKLQRLKVGALFMEPGTGKTLTAIKLIESTNADMVLFLTPFRNRHNIANEFKKWGMNKSHRIIGIESLSHADALYLDLLDELQVAEHAFIVVDESLKIKNANAIRSQRIIKLAECSEYRLILNGTPLSKNILDVWNQMEFLSPKILNMSYMQYRDTFIEYINFEYRNQHDVLKVKNYTNLGYLYSLIAPFIYDCALTIEPKQIHEVIHYQVQEGLPNYEFAKQKYIYMIMNNPNVFMAMTQEMQHAYSCEPAKFEAIRPYADNKTIIFCKYLDTKQELEQRFPQCLVMTYGTGSLGLNLQMYNRIIFFDKTFDYAQEEQAEHRIYRLGQNEDCHFIHLTGDVGLERFIDHNIKNKTTLLDGFKTAIINDDTKVILDEL